MYTLPPTTGVRITARAALARLRVLFPSLVTLAHPVNRGYGAAEKTLLIDPAVPVDRAENELRFVFGKRGVG